MRHLIEGYDYKTQQPVALTRQEWQQRIATAIAAGGKRRFEGSVQETFIDGAPPDPRPIAEIYANIPDQKRRKTHG